jgi:LacI family transcriptional regulator
VFAANDLMALGVMRCFLDAGVLIPAQMAVAGYDDIQIASMIRPSLTTVAQPAYRMGAVAAEVLLERLNSGPGHPRKVHVLDPTLVVRDSTGGR